MSGINQQFRQDLRTFILADASVAALIGNRLFTVNADHSPTTPYIVLHSISGSKYYAHDGDTYLDEARLQFSIFAPLLSTCEQVRDALVARLSGHRGTMGSSRVGFIFFENEVDLYEEDTNLRHKAVDFQVSS